MLWVVFCSGHTVCVQIVCRSLIPEFICRSLKPEYCLRAVDTMSVCDEQIMPHSIGSTDPITQRGRLNRPQKVL